RWTSASGMATGAVGAAFAVWTLIATPGRSTSCVPPVVATAMAPVVPVSSGSRTMIARGGAAAGGGGGGFAQAMARTQTENATSAARRTVSVGPDADGKGRPSGAQGGHGGFEARRFRRQRRDLARDVHRRAARHSQHEPERALARHEDELLDLDL